MYAIPFVLSIVMLLSILSYSNLRAFLNFSIVQNEYQRYLGEQEQSFYNHEVERLYNRERKSASHSSHSKAGVKHLKRTLNIRNWLDPRCTDSTKDQYGLIVERLMDHLYKNQPFFGRFYKERPDLNKQILNHLKDKGKPLQGHLANIDLGDSVLQEAFAAMLAGNIDAEQWEKKSKQGIDLQGYYRSLNDFIDYVGESERKLSIYLARKELLYAIYNDSNIVLAVIQCRNECYQKYKDDRNTGETMLQQHIPIGFDPQLFDFSTSGTKPPDYAATK